MRYLEHITMVIASGVTVWACRVPGVEEGTLLLALALWVSALMLWGVRLRRQAAPRGKLPASWCRLVPWSLVLAVLGALAVVGSGYPERIAFWYSVKPMTQAAESCLALPLGNDDRPRWIGCYRVRQLDRFGGGVLVSMAGVSSTRQFLMCHGWGYFPHGVPESSTSSAYRHVEGAWYVWTYVAE